VQELFLTGGADKPYRTVASKGAYCNILDVLMFPEEQRNVKQDE
jgi:hypothetical protein